MDKKNERQPQKYVKQPYPLSTLATDLTLQQTHILVEMMDSVSSRVGEMFDRGSRLLFREEDFVDGTAHIDVDFRSLTSRPDCYRDVEAIARKMVSAQMEYTEQKPEGLTKIIINAFESVEIPREGNRRQGIIRFNLTRRQATSLFDFTRYSKYLKSVARNTSSVYTARIYMLITAWRKFGYWNADYDELRKSLGCNEYDKEEKVWKPKKYAEYRQFKRRVLKTAEEELRRLAGDGEVDCWFDFQEIYAGGRVTAHPEKIHFNVHTTSMGAIEDRRQQDARGRFRLQAELQALFGLAEAECRQILSKVDDGMAEQFTIRVREIAESMDRQAGRIRDRRRYALKSLHEAVLEFTPQAEEVKAAAAAGTPPPGQGTERTAPAAPDNAAVERWRATAARIDPCVAEVCTLTADCEGVCIEVPGNLSFDVFRKDIGIIETAGFRIRKA